jgi:hypothetical protein
MGAYAWRIIHHDFGDFNVSSISPCTILGASGYACNIMFGLKCIKGNLKRKKRGYYLDDQAYTFVDKGWEQAI